MIISLILPVYNPAKGWVGIVMEKSKEINMRCADAELEIIVVNDGSVNSAFEEGEQKLLSGAIKLIAHTPNKGKGEALRQGVASSTGDIIIYTDIDFPYTISSIENVIKAISAGADVVIGIKDTNYYKHVPPVRRFISRVFRFFVRLLLRIPTDDTQCGLKGFNKKGKEIFLQTTIQRYLFDLEFIFLAARAKEIIIKTQEIQLREDVQFRKMNMKVLFTEAWNFLKILLFRS